MTMHDTYKAVVLGIFAFRQSITVLHFDKIPLLDRRVLAVILRSCPNVTSLGVYDCPLLHIGDIVCLLDLISEVNMTRLQQKKPLITSFDFFPCLERGMPFKHPSAATYGLTWNPVNLEVAQKGLYVLLLKAFAKAYRMKLAYSLFDEHQGLRKYLLRIPNPPFGVPMFLDALYRMMSRPDKHKEQKVIADLLRPIHLDFGEKFPDDGPFQRPEPEKPRFFCASCGYEMLEEFFVDSAVLVGWNDRVCCGCLLQCRLGMERHRLKKAKRECLDHLFPNHYSRDFNPDAPLARGFGSIIRLSTTRVEALNPALPLVLPHSPADGSRTQERRPLLRNKKASDDSLVNLPTFHELLFANSAEETWKEFGVKCRRVDAFSCASRLAMDQLCGQNSPATLERIRSLSPLGKPDHWEEMQLQKHGHFSESYTFETALQRHLFMVSKGWLPGGSPSKVVNKARLDTYNKNKSKEFW